jgi:hypothetical protein
MITLHRIDRLFSEHQHPRLYRELVAARPEAFLGLDSTLSRVAPIAALGMIRLEELNQAHTSTYRRLLNVLLTSQQRDGGWGDAMTTALAVRALLSGGGQGPAVERGLNYLANLQTEEALWPVESNRRMPGNALVSAFVLMQLGDRTAFRQAVHFGAALAWFTTNRKSLDPATQRLWNHAAVRCCSAASRDGAEGLFLHVGRRPAA